MSAAVDLRFLTIAFPRMRASVFVVCTLFCLTSVAFGQSDGERLARFQMAESYLRAGQIDRAIPLLEGVYAEDPSSFIYFDRLKQAYEDAKRYEEAVALIERHEAGAPSPPLRAEKARMIFLSGDDAGAYEVWEEAVNLAPESRGTYVAVYRSLVDARLLDRAIDVLSRARGVLGDDAFRNDLGMLYMATGRYEDGIREQLAMLREDERRMNSIIGTLSRYSEQPEALAAATRVTEEAVREDPLVRGFRELLSWLYLETGNYHGALNESRAIDRLERQEGRVLLGFAQRAVNASAFEAAAEAYEDVIDRYGQTSIMPHALLGRATLHERWAQALEEQAAPTEEISTHIDRALDAYRMLAERFPSHPSYPQVRHAQGRLLLDGVGDLDAAAQAFRDVINRFPRSSEAGEAEFQLARIATLRGNLEDARIGFSRIVDEHRIGDLAERARMEVARVHFFRSEFEAARAMLDVLDVNTSTDVANDALELKVVILENRGPDSLNTALSRFASASLLAEQGRHQDALGDLDDLLNKFGRHGIADEARFLRARSLAELGLSVDAAEAFVEVAAYHPNSHLADRALFEASILQYRRLNDPASAAQTLTRLLTEYPGSMFIQQARSLLRDMRDDSRSDSI